MALNENKIVRSEALSPIIEDYTDWFGRMATHMVFPNEETRTEPPATFKSWYDNVGQYDDIKQEIINELLKLHQSLIDAGQYLADVTNNGGRPTHRDFTNFKNYYDAFLSSIRRIEKEAVSEDIILDEQTGLRSQKILINDLNREMERLNRQGNPFCVVIARIDRFAGHQNQSHSLQVATSNIKRCMRSFDDAYYTSLGNFIISLKHTDIVGAQAATTRLQRFLKNDANNTNKITMSYCLSEPVLGNDMTKLIKDMQSDLNSHINDRDTIVRFVEVSPIQRYIGAME